MGIFSSDVKEIKIIWDTKSNPGRAFFPGENVCGKAVLVTEKDDVKIQKATIKITGSIEIKFREVRLAKNNKQKIHFEQL